MFQFALFNVPYTKIKLFSIFINYKLQIIYSRYFLNLIDRILLTFSVMSLIYRYTITQYNCLCRIPSRRIYSSPKSTIDNDIGSTHAELEMTTHTVESRTDSN